MNINIYVTRRCNLRCEYCYEKDWENAQYSDINIDKCKEIVRFIQKKLTDSNDKNLHIIFHGGEPLLNISSISYLIEKTSKLKEEGIQVVYDMCTNGTIYTKETDELLEKIDNLTISIDGKKETHNKYRKTRNGEYKFDETLKFIKNIKDRSRVRARMTVLPDTLEYLYDNILYLDSLGFGFVSPSIDMFSKWTEQDFHKLYSELERVKNNINKVSCKVGMIFEDGQKFKPLGKCQGGITDFTITTDGEIYPCLVSIGEKEFKIGSLYDQEMNEKLIDDIMKVSSTDNPSCRMCSFRRCCTSNRCKIINKIYSGEYEVPCINECKLNNILYSLNKY